MIDLEAELKSGKYEPHMCGGCNEVHSPNPPVKKNFDMQKMRMIKRAAQHVIDTGKWQFKKSELNLADFGQSAYGNFPSLARYGLITMATDKETKQRVRGLWFITPLGWNFLRGEKPIKSWVVVKDKHVQHEYGYGREMYLKELFRTVDTIETTFEYIDDNGNMIARRPSSAPERNAQTTLLDIPAVKPRREYI